MFYQSSLDFFVCKDLNGKKCVQTLVFYLKMIVSIYND